MKYRTSVSCIVGYGKGVPHYRPWRTTGDVGARIHIFAATALGRGRIASARLGSLYPQESRCIYFTGGWVSPRVWMNTKEGKYISTPSGSNPGHPALVAKRLASWATWPIILNVDFRTMCVWDLQLYHGRLARWIKWKACDVGEAKEGLENELWRRWSNGMVGEWAVT